MPKSQDELGLVLSTRRLSVYTHRQTHKDQDPIVPFLSFEWVSACVCVCVFSSLKLKKEEKNRTAIINRRETLYILLSFSLRIWRRRIYLKVTRGAPSPSPPSFALLDTIVEAASSPGGVGSLSQFALPLSSPSASFGPWNKQEFFFFFFLNKIK